MKSSPDSPEPAKSLSGRISVKIRGLGPCPAFKNSKQLFVRDGTPGMASKKGFKAWMARAARAIAYQLLSACQTGGGGITPACSKQSAMSLLPPDDCWEDLEIGSVRTILVPPGEEGADLTIERII